MATPSQNLVHEEDKNLWGGQWRVTPVDITTTGSLLKQHEVCCCFISLGAKRPCGTIPSVYPLLNVLCWLQAISCFWFYLWISRFSVINAFYLQFSYCFPVVSSLIEQLLISILVPFKCLLLCIEGITGLTGWFTRGYHNYESRNEPTVSLQFSVCLIAFTAAWVIRSCGLGAFVEI